MSVAAIDLDPGVVTDDDPVQSARNAGLQYVHDGKPGIRRAKVGEEFRYLDRHGALVDDPKTLERIASLAIPPAWTDVWICPNPRGHLQATGRDAKGRKQYRYHPRWREARDETKYERMIAFAQALPTIRERVNRDLAQKGLPTQKVLATVVRLLEATLIRVGNEEYARENEHYGLTTLRTEHVEVSSSILRFHFVGKSGKEHHVGLRDRRLARIIRQLQELPGQELFQFVDEAGQRHPIGSADVNAYLREISGQDFTAKDFRTWAGTVFAAWALLELEAAESPTQVKKNVGRAIEVVAGRLGNTPAVCRKCYVHPGVIDAYTDGALLQSLRSSSEIEWADVSTGLPPNEAQVLALLQGRGERDAERAHAS
jgi:DNA topoisomerase-1